MEKEKKYTNIVLATESAKQLELLEEIIELIDGEDEKTLEELHRLMIGYFGIKAGKYSKLSFFELTR